MNIQKLCEAGETLQLGGAFSIQYSDERAIFQLMCCGNFVYANESFDNVMSRYCMQVVLDNLEK